MLIDVLKNLGLNSKEAQVYLATLEIGTSPVSAIALKGKINRVTTYDILEKLVQKGLISSVTKNKIKYFTAIDPEILNNEFKRKVQDLQKALPDLKRLKGDTIHPHVRYFEGIEGIKAIYADTLSSKTEILNYANSQEIRIHWPTYDEDYVTQRAQKKIYLRGIAPDDIHGQSVHNNDTENYREIRLVPKDEFDFTNEINIYDHKVAIISFKDELIGMIIESSQIANTQRAIFKMAWEFCVKNKPAMMIRKVGNLKNSLPAEDMEEKKQISLF